jgi:hypothetical protein
MNFDFGKIAGYLVPVLISLIVWLFTTINEQEEKLAILEYKMMLLVTPDGKIVPSGGSERVKAELKEELHELDKRITVLENK